MFDALKHVFFIMHSLSGAATKVQIFCDTHSFTYQESAIVLYGGILS